MSRTSLLALLQLTDPALPIGGFAHSAGLETYVQKGLVHDLATTKAFITQILTQNIQYTDGAFVSLAFEAAQNNDLSTVLQLDDVCTAVKLPREMRQASRKLGVRLLKIFSSSGRSAVLDNYRQAVTEQKAYGHYAIVFGLFASAFRIPKEEALTGFYYNAAAGMVTNSVKLIPLGQQDGQGLLISLHPLLQQLARKTLVPDKDAIGICCAGFDIRCMQHERLYSRLYMS